jgi:hypothetical protein
MYIHHMLCNLILMSLYTLPSNQGSGLTAPNCYKKKLMNFWLKFLTPVCEFPSLNLHWGGTSSRTCLTRVHQMHDEISKHLSELWMIQS